MQKQLAYGRFGSEGEMISEALNLLECKNIMSGVKESLKANQENFS